MLVSISLNITGCELNFSCFLLVSIVFGELPYLSFAQFTSMYFFKNYFNKHLHIIDINILMLSIYCK